MATFSVSANKLMATVSGMNDGDGEYVVVAGPTAQTMMVGLREGPADDVALLKESFSFRHVGSARRAYRDALDLATLLVTAP